MATPKRQNGFDREDRDLLVELRTEMTALRGDMKDLKDNTSVRLTLVENKKIDRDEFTRYQTESTILHEDHESRLRAQDKAIGTTKSDLEAFQGRMYTWGTAAVLLLGVVQFVVGKVWK